MSRRLFVGGLPWKTKSEELEALFAQFGGVVSANVVADRYSGRSKGYGFVEMDTQESASRALEALNNSDFEGRTMTVDVAKAQPETGDSIKEES